MSKKVSKLGLLTMSIGGMIGWGAFMQPGLTFLPQAGLLNTIIGMFIGLVMVSTIASCYGIILNKTPDSIGGEYSYSKIAFEKIHSFIVGWFLLIVFIGIAAMNATSFALMFKNVVFPETDFITLYTVAGSPVTLGEVLLSILVVAVFSWFMIKGVESVIIVQNIITIALIFIVVGVFAGSLFMLDVAASPLPLYLSANNISLSGIISILVLMPWAYYGVSTIPKVASDANLPYKKVISITVVSLICGFFMYQMLLLITAFEFSQSDLLGFAGWATGEAVRTNFGLIGLIVITFGLSFAIFSGVNGFYMGASRVMLSMSEDGVLSKVFSIKHKKFGTPHLNIIFILLVIIIAPFFGRQVLIWIVEMAALGGALVFFYTSLTAFKISKGIEKIVGLVATIFSAIFIALLSLPFSPGFLSWQSLLALLIWSVLGFILFAKAKNQTNELRGKEASIRV